MDYSGYYLDMILYVHMYDSLVIVRIFFSFLFDVPDILSFVRFHSLHFLFLKVVGDQGGNVLPTHLRVGA